MILELIVIFFQKTRKTLFSNIFNSVISLILILVIFCAFLNTVSWLFNHANWKVVTTNLPLYAFGSFPRNEHWRPTVWLFSHLTLSVITLFGPEWKWLRKNLLIAWASTIPLGLYLLYGGLGLSPIMSRHWGGLTLSILLTTCSSLFSLPLGIVLALCRQSSLPLVKRLSSIYIDVMRAIPLIAVLFFGHN